MRLIKIKYSILVIAIAQLYACGFNCANYIDNQIKPLKINAIITGKFKAESGCFGSIIYAQGQRIDTLKNICYCVVENEKIWHYASYGDSIAKNSGQTTLYIFRKGAIKAFEFPCCSQ